MTAFRLFIPDIRALLQQLPRIETFFFLLSGIFWIAGLYHPVLGLLFYASLLYPVLYMFRFRPSSSQLYFFLLPYFLTVGLGVWNSIFPYGLGILLALLLCDLFSKLLAFFLTSAAAFGGGRIMLLPAALAFMDAVFQKVPVLTAMEMIPVLAPIYHHAPMLATAAWLGRHLTILLLFTGTTAILLLLYFALAGLQEASFQEKQSVVVIAFVCTAAVAAANVYDSRSAPSAPSIAVTAVQASLGFNGEDAGLSGEEAFAFRYARYLETAGSPAGDIVLFPEIMVGLYDTENQVDQGYRDKFRQQAASWDTLLVPLVLEGNSRTQDPADRRITALVVAADGILGRSSKRNLVPFSESRHFGQGSDYRAIATPLGRIGPSICYDANGPTIRRLASDGAQIILAPFNNTDFTTVFHTVHRFYPIIQALEYQIPVAVANESGISQIIDSSGRILAALPIGAVDTITVTVPLSAGPSPYLRYGVFGEIAALGLFLYYYLSIRRRNLPPHNPLQ